MFTYNIYEIPHMMDYVDCFFREQSRRFMGLGEVIGVDILQMVISTAMAYFEFHDILIIDGCQDYIGLYKKKIPNHIFYAETILNELQSRAYQYNACFPKWCQEKDSYRRKINNTKLGSSPLIIIHHANLIDSELLQNMIKIIPGRVIVIGDPFAMNGELFLDYPTLVDTLSKMSPLLSTARQLYGIESRGIDRSIHGEIKETKLTRRSIGKIDRTQYVTNDEMLLNEIREKQSSVRFRKGQKIMIDSNMIYRDSLNTITNYSMGTITQLQTQTKQMEIRLYNSKDIFTGNMSYVGNEHSLSPIKVKPANILSIKEAMHHRFQSLHLVLTNEDITVQEYYSLLGITNNLLISRI